MHVKKLLIIELSPICSTYITLLFKYSPQHTVLRRPRSVSFTRYHEMWSNSSQPLSLLRCGLKTTAERSCGSLHCSRAMFEVQNWSGETFKLYNYFKRN
jgi:hypothetical protein